MNAFVAAPVFAILMGGTAHAALTADQVWQSWKDAAALAGLTISAATEANSGGVLTLNGLTVSPAGATGGLTISDMTMTEEGDGSVTIRPGASIAMDASADGRGVKIGVNHEGLEIKAHEGDGGALVYDYAAAKLGVDFDSSMTGAPAADGSTGPAATSKGVVNLEGVSGTYSDTPGANRAFGLDLAAAKMAYDVKTDDPSLALKTASLSETTDVAASLDVTMPSTVNLAQIAGAADFGKALSEGFAVALSMKQGETKSTVSQDAEMMPYQMTMTTLPGEATLNFNKDTFAVKSTGAGIDLGITTPMAPVPINIKSGPVAMTMVSPVMAGEVAGDYAFGLSLSQFTLNEEAWGMVDPGGALKRDPADISIDLSGKAKVDWVAMIAAQDAGAAPLTPAPESLDIKDLTVKIAGTALTAVGAFTFDNAMGTPMPLGSADVSLTGGTALIDGLIKTGLMTEDDAMGARMMMGAFMTPGAEPDTLTSKIEAKEGFAIFVNGQRVQ